MAREITPEEIAIADEMIARARAAMEEIKDYDQEQVDRLARALGWNCGNETTFAVPFLHHCWCWTAARWPTTWTSKGRCLLQARPARWGCTGSEPTSLVEIIFPGSF